MTNETQSPNSLLVLSTAIVYGFLINNQRFAISPFCLAVLSEVLWYAKVKKS